jgi:WD40 repeat protein
VPTGAGEARQLTHDNITYTAATYAPDGKHLLASGIEPGHGARDYLIDLTTGEPRPLTPEGTSFALLSPDGRSDAVQGPDGKWGIWPLEGSVLRLIPGLDSKYNVAGWSADGALLYVNPSGTFDQPILKLYRVNIATGKIEFWRTFGDVLPTGAYAFSPEFSADGSAFAYGYGQILSQAYVVKGLK